MLYSCIFLAFLLSLSLYFRLHSYFEVYRLILLDWCFLMYHKASYVAEMQSHFRFSSEVSYPCLKVLSHCFYLLRLRSDNVILAFFPSLLSLNRTLVFLFQLFLVSMSSTDDSHSVSNLFIDRSSLGCRQADDDGM